MCGIAGFVSRDRQPVATIVGMTDAVRHRGPDDEGFVLFASLDDEPHVLGGRDTPPAVYAGGSVYAPSRAVETTERMPITLALGHRRLSILDLSPLGHQPMCTPDGRYWIVYNGEIYNHIELRRELTSLGHAFLSRSDTEVVLAAYARWGPESLDRFNGMWALAIYDTQRRELFLARDRFGVKPLYYWSAPDGTLCFGSEVKQFTTFPGWRARVNPQPTYDFLAWGVADHTSETLFAGVRQLAPGHYARARVGDPLEVTRWYTLRPAEFAGSFDDAAREFRERLTDSIRLRLRADVPVGSCLSGGLDSSSIVCIMAQLLAEQDAAALQKTFSACAAVRRFDEREWIDEVIRAIRADAHYVYPDLDGVFAESRALTWHQDEPFGSTSIYAQWSVFRLAGQNGVRVMLDGQGGDELLAGYPSFFGARFAGLLRSGRLAQLWSDIQATKQRHGHSEGRSLMFLANMILPSALRQPLRALAGRSHAAPSWLNVKVLGAAARDPLASLGGYTDSIQAMSLAQLTATNLQMLLHWEDRNSMAHSVEARVPFLDYRLVEFVLGLPDDFKLAGGVTKRVLRRGLDGLLPDRIRDRPDKVGFVTPEECWVREQAPDLFRQRLRQAVDASQGVLGPESLDELEAIIVGKRPFSFVPWRLVNLGEWMETFSVSRS